MENKNDGHEINPSEFIKNAVEIRSKKVQQELMEKLQREQQIIQDKIDRKVRDLMEKDKLKKKVKSIEDVLKKGDKIRWDIVGNGNMKGFVKNRLVFEIKRGMTIFNLYIKDTSLLKEGSNIGYLSCSSNIQTIKNKSEKLIK